MRRASTGLGIAVALVLGSACEASFTPAVAPTVDLHGKIGFEARAALALSIGSESTRGSEGIALGGGYNRTIGRYFTHDVAGGMQFGDIRDKPPVRGGVTLGYRSRVGSKGLYNGAFLGLDTLFLLAEGQDPFGIVLLGPRFEANVFVDPVGEPRVDPSHIQGMFSLGLAMQWIFWAYYGERRIEVIRSPPPPPPPVQTIAVPVDPGAPIAPVP